MRNINPIWDCLPGATKWQINNRNIIDTVANSDYFRIHQGINYSIILNSACIVEGILDYLSRHLILTKSSFNKDNLNEIDQEIINHFLEDIRLKTWSKYDAVIKLLVKSTLKKLIGKVSPNLYVHLEHLFKYRNVLAHGQSIDMQLIFSDLAKSQIKDIEFKNNFHELIEYLRKNKLAEKKYKDNTLFTDVFFTNKVADHFFSISEEFALNLEKIFGRDIPYNLSSAYLSPLFYIVPITNKLASLS